MRLHLDYRGGKALVEPVVFVASLPPSKTAVQIDGGDAEASIKFIAPSSELAQVIRLALLVGKRLKVTVEPYQGR